MRCVFVLFLLLLLPLSARAAPPRRVVSVNVCTDEYVFRLLPKDRIAALSYLAGDRHPVVSTIADEVSGIPLIRQSAEAVLATNPDLVVLDAGATARTRAILKTAHVPTYNVVWAQSLDEVRRVTRALAERLGVSERGEELLAEMDRSLAAARATAPADPVRALLYQPNGYTLAGGLAETMMTAGGLANIAPVHSPTRQGTLPIETVLATAPDLIIFSGDPAIVDSRARQVLHHPALKALVNRTAMVWLPLTSLLCPGPWSAAAALDFARTAHALAGVAPQD